MWQHSANPGQTARLIETDLNRRFPGGSLEIFYRAKERAAEEYWTGDLASLLQKMRGSCDRCAGALFHYNPSHQYGMVCTAVCACESPCPACTQQEHRPRVMVLLTHNGARDILIGYRGTPAGKRNPAPLEPCAR